MCRDLGNRFEFRSLLWPDRIGFRCNLKPGPFDNLTEGHNLNTEILIPTVLSQIIFTTHLTLELKLVITSSVYNNF